MSLVYGYAEGGEEGAKDMFKDTSILYNLSGKAAQETAEETAKTAAEAQQNALNYLKEVERVPQALRTAGTERLGAMYGMGPQEYQDAAFEEMMSSPMSKYLSSISSSRVDAQESALARNRAMTGGLRSGATQRGLAQINAAEEERLQREILSSHMRGMGQLGQLQTNPEGIATGMTNVGNTLASGQLASAQAQQQGMANVAGLGMAAMAAFSDERLKSNVEYEGEINGHSMYSWEWNEEAKKLGLSGRDTGVIAQEVQKTNPDAVFADKSGYLKVDYSKLGVH